MLKNIIFDFGGVMYRYEPDYLLSCCYESAEDAAAAKPVIYREWHRLDEGTVDYDQYAAETEALLPEHLRAGARKYLYNWHRFEPPMEQTWALAARLKARGYKIFLLSNAPVTFAADLDIYPILKIFDGLVVSAPIQMVKPNADIFLHTLEKYGLKAGESLFVDDLEVNCDGARAVGMYGYTYSGDADKLLEYIESLS
ncbi:MAG: HAD family phosphatase [Clostridiales bacterium]|nr:HAD family phosphatase [Clostridiales bacterium]